MASRTTLTRFTIALIATMRDLFDVVSGPGWGCVPPWDATADSGHIPHGFTGALTYFATAINLPEGDLTLHEATAALTRFIDKDPATAVTRQDALPVRTFLGVEAPEAVLADPTMLGEYLFAHVNPDELAPVSAAARYVFTVAFLTLAFATRPAATIEQAMKAAVDWALADLRSTRDGMSVPRAPGTFIAAARAFTDWDALHLNDEENCIGDGAAAVAAENAWERMLCHVALAHSHQNEWTPDDIERGVEGSRACLLPLTYGHMAGLTIPDEVYTYSLAEAFPYANYGISVGTYDVGRVKAIRHLITGHVRSHGRVPCPLGIPGPERTEWLTGYDRGYRKVLVEGMHVLIGGGDTPDAHAKVEQWLRDVSHGVDIREGIACAVADGIALTEGWEDDFLAS